MTARRVSESGAECTAAAREAGLQARVRHEVPELLVVRRRPVVADVLARFLGGCVHVGIGFRVAVAVITASGRVVMAAIRVEFAVVGDTVNVASRLERLSRALAATIVASDALVAAVRAESHDGARLVAGLHAAPEQRLRGRADDVAVWYLPARSAAGAA